MNDDTNDEIPAAENDPDVPAGPTADKTQSCPTCGEPITPSAPPGLCPKCSMAAVADHDASGNTATVALPKFEAPAIEEVAKAFPQLEILELIGCGGMGAVYRARQPHLERMVALKILPKSLAESPEFTERFTREARTLAKLAHPNIVGIFDFGESGGYFFLIMEYVDGVNLRQAMRAGRFTPAQAFEVVPEICNALQFAHDEGVLHRDIKPENILLDTKGRIKIADFGIAKLLNDTARGLTLTQGMAPGTPQYMAPEQIEQPATVDHRADIYSLGVVLYEMLTGELPIGRFAAPSEKTGVGADIDEIVFRALEKDRERRQQSAGEVRTDLAGVPPLTDVPAPPTAVAAGVPYPKADPKNRPELALLLSIASVVLPVILFVIVILGANTVRVSEAQHAISIRKIETLTAQALALRTHEQEEILATLAADHPKAKEVAGEIVVLKRQREALRSRETASSRMDEVMATMLQGLASIVFVLVCIVPATVFAWKQLRRQRVVGQRQGRIPLLAAAWLWPMALLVCLVLGVFLFALSNAPAWALSSGVVVAVLISIALGTVLVRRTLKWLNQSVTATERGACLDRERKAPPVSPFKARTMTQGVLIGGAFGIICLFVSLFLAGSYYRMMVVVMSSGVAVVLLCGYVLLLNRSYHPGSARSRADGYNPWPKRIFWLVLIVFLAPSIMAGVSLLMPVLASPTLNRIEGDYAVAVNRVIPDDAGAAVVLQTRRKSPGVLKAIVVLDGPVWRGPRESSTDKTEKLNRIYPGDRLSWSLDAESLDVRTLGFVFPEKKAADEAYLQMNRLAGKSNRNAPLYPELQRLPLFELSSDGDQYRAWVEFEFVPGR